VKFSIDGLIEAGYSPSAAQEMQDMAQGLAVQFNSPVEKELEYVVRNWDLIVFTQSRMELEEKTGLDVHAAHEVLLSIGEFLVKTERSGKRIWKVENGNDA
jgi:hypothetical protein